MGKEGRQTRVDVTRMIGEMRGARGLVLLLRVGRGRRGRMLGGSALLLKKCSTARKWRPVEACKQAQRENVMARLVCTLWDSGHGLVSPPIPLHRWSNSVSSFFNPRQNCELTWRRERLAPDRKYDDPSELGSQDLSTQQSQSLSGVSHAGSLPFRGGRNQCTCSCSYPAKSGVRDWKNATTWPCN